MRGYLKDLNERASSFRGDRKSNDDNIKTSFYT